MRPGCDRRAEARLSYDTIGCQVWLDALTERPGRSQEICSLHAQRLTVPRGWMLCDRRVDEPALFVAAVGGSAATVVTTPPTTSSPTPRPNGRPGRRRRAADSSRHPAATLELFEHADPVPEVVPEPEPQPEPEPEPVAAVEPEPEPDVDEVPESLRATSPLLSRAFAATGHQRSVLTQRRAEDDD
jgi:hypothetical protein